MLTEIVFILDRSGSMAGLEKDTIGGFNSLIDKQKKEEGEAFVTCVLFDHEQDVIYDRVNLKEISPMNESQYYVRGCTALYDAIGSTIEHIKNIHKYIRKEDVPEKTIFVITTDGLENSSRRYTLNKVRKLVEAQKEKGWEFLFLGANLDAVAVGKNFGFDEDKSVTFENDVRGQAINYAAVSQAVTCVRSGKSLKRAWKKNIEEDFKKRHI